MTTAPLTTNDFRSSAPLKRRVAVAIASRAVLFFSLQAVIAGLLAIGNVPSPWSTSVAWWPISATVANFMSLLLLSIFYRAEGSGYWRLWRFDRSTVGEDLLTTLGLLLVAGVLAIVPNVGLATLLWGDPQVGLSIFIGRLPVWAAVVALVGFPVSIALSELPTYYAYARPRLEALGWSPPSAVSLAALMHALQHAVLPVVFDWRFLLWRSFMFLPFALFVAVALRWRPRLLPYLMVAHGLLDLSVAVMVLQASV